MLCKGGNVEVQTCARRWEEEDSKYVDVQTRHALNHSAYNTALPVWAYAK